MPEIYQPQEDSYLMSENLRKEIPKLLKQNPQLKFLEIGAGSGINLVAAKESGIKAENILGCDMNKDAVKHCQELGFNCVKSDLFSKIKGKFGIIAFNPPYLPRDINEPNGSRINTTGGAKGNELAIKFLKQSKKHLNKDGRIFLITSSLSSEIDFEKQGYKFREIGSTNMFFEKIYLWELESK